MHKEDTFCTIYQGEMIAEIDRIGTDGKTDFFDYRNVITDIHQ